MKVTLCALLLNGLVTTVGIAAGPQREPAPSDRECRYYFELDRMQCTTTTGAKHDWTYLVRGQNGLEKRKNFNRWVLDERNCWLMKQNVNPQRDEFVLFEPSPCARGQRGTLSDPDPF